jgi:hypothetical protein
MTIGPAVTKGTLSSEAGLHATRIRQLAFDLKNFQAKVDKLGHGNLVSAGYSDTDGSWPPSLGGDGTKDEADWMQYLADLMGAVADLITGDAAQPQPFAFTDAFAVLA